MDFSQKDCGATIKRVLSPNSDHVVEYIENHFNKTWASEAKASLYRPHPNCFIAVIDQKIVGFACYDATAKAFFGPTGVSEEARGKGIGKALLLHTLEAMLHDGYAYAIIGATNSAIPFYEKVCGAIKIENSTKVYNRLIHR